MMVPYERTGLVDVAPAAQPPPPRQVGVLVVDEEPIVEGADVVEVAPLEQDRSPAPGEHLRRFVELALVDLEEATVAGETTGEEIGAQRC